MRVPVVILSVIVLLACDSRSPLPVSPSSVPDSLRPGQPAAPADTVAGVGSPSANPSLEVGGVVACGATIVSNMKLGHDLTCPAGGLIIGADGIKLDLNGHTITGAGTGDGISIIGRNNVSISGGTVRSFFAGVRIMNSTDVIVKGNEFLENTDGVDCQAGCAGNTIKENSFADSRTRGVMLRTGSSNNVVKENTFTGNRTGILLFAPVDTIVKENIISGSSVAGIRVNVFATANLIIENTVMSNPAGIEFLVNQTGSATGNTLLENTIATNTCGLKGPTSGNTIRENVFDGNGADSCA